jgi:hypothetical protein
MKILFGWSGSGVPDIRLWQYKPQVAAVLPRSIDLRETGFVSPVRSQLYGNCVDHALAGVDEFLRAKMKLSPQFPASVMYPYFRVRLMEHTFPQDSGSSILDAVKCWMKYGIPPEVDMPEDQAQLHTLPSVKAIQDASQHKLTAYYGLKQTETDLMDCLVSGYPWVDGKGIYDTFPGVQGEDGSVKNPDDGTGQVPEPNPQNDTLVGGHSTGTYGYSKDPKSYMVDGKTVHIPYPHWISKNSWGIDFGHRGWFYPPWQYALNPLLSSEQVQAVREK